MHPEIAQRRVSADYPHRVSAHGRFRAYMPETARSSRITEVRQSPTATRLMDLFYRCVAPDEDEPRRIGKSYKEYAAAVHRIDYTAADIGAFIAAAAQYGKEYWRPSKTGLFISALVNSSSIADITLPLYDMTGIKYLGYRNRKIINALGNLGDCAGSKMNGGRLTVGGDVGNRWGWK